MAKFAFISLYMTGYGKNAPIKRIISIPSKSEFVMDKTH